MGQIILQGDHLDAISHPSNSWIKPEINEHQAGLIAMRLAGVDVNRDLTKTYWKY